MLDMKLIIANPDEVKRRLSLRKPELAAQIDEVLSLYENYKKVLAAASSCTACVSRAATTSSIFRSICFLVAMIYSPLVILG